MSILLGTVALPAGLRWLDEFDPQAVTQSVRRRLDGSPTIYVRTNAAGGRSITLEADALQWLNRTTAAALLALAAVPDTPYPLVFQERANLTFSVLFRHQDAPALDLRPLIDYADPSGVDAIIGQIKLMTI
jgi:hypothetical protein